MTREAMNIKFLAVRGNRSRNPVVLAIADTNRVRWNPRGWDCQCPEWTAGADTCIHVEEVAALLDHRVLAEDA